MLISDNLFIHLKQIVDLNEEYCRKLFELSDYKDTFSIFFIHYFLKFQPKTKKKYIIYFDNLDIAPMEYLSDVFFKFFGEALRNANKISELPIMQDKDIYLPRDFRFIFCLRDANEAFINQQLASRYDFRKEPFKLSFPTMYYKNIISKRVDFISKVYENDDIKKYNLTVQEIKDSFSALVSDDYFNGVFVPLFNKDYRETVAALLDTIVKYKLPQKKEQLEYGVRGYLLFNLIKELLKDNFLRNYLRLSASREDGYCYLDRVLLTVLVNGSKYVRSENGNDLTSNYSLLSIIRDLDGFYNVEEIVESVTRGFLYHTKNWVHLITIYNTSITEANEKQFIIDIVAKYTLAIENNDSMLFAEIDNIKLRVNPAGFTHLRYILPHFEFYSNMAGNESPLLELKYSKDDDGVYLFEKAIDNAFKIVERHCESMKLFFNNKYLKNGIDKERYYKSIYCFRHLGKSSIALDKGYFHSSRIISYHIDYIDYFRHDLINNYVQDVDEVRKINQSIIKRLIKYINLLEGSMDIRAINEFGSILKELVSKIVKSNYKDTTTRINTR